MYHYAANNPVRYTDPDGREVTNNSDQYILNILIRTEDKGYVVLPPHTIYTGKNVLDSTGKKMDKIDNGKIDGVILSSGTTFKVSDTKYLFYKNVSVTINQNEDDNSLSVDYSSSNDRDFSMKNYNLKLSLKKNDDPPGEGKVGVKGRGGEWLSVAPSQDKLKAFVKMDENNKEAPTFVEKQTIKETFKKEE